MLITFLAAAVPTARAQTSGTGFQGAAAQAAAATPANLSLGASEVVKLVSSGVSEEVVLAYIQNSQAVFNLSADDVLYLKDIGLSPQVTSAMLNHDSTLRGQTAQYAPVATTPTPIPATALVPATTATVATTTITAPVYVSSPPADVVYFYNDLAPYGTWVSLEGFGWCWQPRAVLVSRGWRPYCDGGHWIYTDFGWYWQSDYTWGWAPFHYGRWHLHPSCGWVWLPDRVWGPAWVTWRVAGDSCGWAPLPPHAEFDVRLGWRFNGVSVGVSFDFGLGINAFTFVTFGDFCGRDLHRHCLPPDRVRGVYHQTTIINNYVVNDNRIVHRGIPIERVSAASRVQVPRATVRDWQGRPDRMPGRTASVVYRPQLQAPAQPGRMAAQRVDERRPVIQHAPVTTGKAERASAYSRGEPAPGVPARPSAAEAPKSSSWSGTKIPPTPAVPRAPAVWKQGIRSAPGYRSDAGLPALNNTRPTQSPSTAAQRIAGRPQVQAYYPSTSNQAAGASPRSRSAQPQSAAPSSQANDLGASSKRNR